MCPKTSRPKTPALAGPLKMPIGVAHKLQKFSISKQRKRLSNPILDDRGHPDPQETWEYILPKIKAGRLLHKHKYSAPNLTAVDLPFGKEYDEAVHGKTMRKELNLYHLSTIHQKADYEIIKKFWRVFSKKGVTGPVKDYKCRIDMISNSPIV